jgi:hypothetical protein
MRVKTKTSGQGKTGSPKLCLFILVTLVSKDLPTFLGEGNMYQAFVETHSGRFSVKSAKVTPQGFVNTKKIDTFSTLAEAEKKAEVANYIFKKISDLSKKYHKEVR